MNEITPEKVAAAACEGVGGWLESLQGALSVTAEDGVLSLSVARWVDDEQGTEVVRHFHAVVIPSDSKPAYVNGDDGYWLTCGTCEEPLVEVKAGTSLGEMAVKVAAHKCAEIAEAETGGAAVAEQEPIVIAPTVFMVETEENVGATLVRMIDQDGLEVNVGLDDHSRDLLVSMLVRNRGAANV